MIEGCKVTGIVMNLTTVDIFPAGQCSPQIHHHGLAVLSSDKGQERMIGRGRSERPGG